jgi:hypothetical protein
MGACWSSDSIAVARIPALEGITHQVSPVSTLAKLSDTNGYPLFSKLVAPDDEHGQVGASVVALCLFGWNCIMHACDFVTSFRSLWEGNFAYSDEVCLDNEGSIDADSVHQFLKGTPMDNPAINS